MKELTIEEKAKAYNEALEKARELQENSNGMVLKKWLWRVFPELQESEDEKIRKKVIEVLKLNIKGAESQMQASRGVDRCFEIYACNKVIAWLEKQGESEDNESNDELTWLKTFIEEEAYYLSMDIRDEVDREKLIKLQNALAWLKKQGEKPTTIDIDKMVLEYSQTKNSDFGLPINCMIEAYRKGINDALHSHILDPNKVIEWLRKNTCAACWDNPDEGVSQRIEQFKKDFEI